MNINIQHHGNYFCSRDTENFCAGPAQDELLVLMASNMDTAREIAFLQTKEGKDTL
jgi:hypothetical protein